MFVNFFKKKLTKAKKVSVVKRFIDNPDDFMLVAIVENEEIKITIKRREDLKED